MLLLLHSTRFLFLGGLLLICPTVAFSRSASPLFLSKHSLKQHTAAEYKPVTTSTSSLHATTTATAAIHSSSHLFRFRGGGQQEEEQVVVDLEEDAPTTPEQDTVAATQKVLPPASGTKRSASLLAFLPTSAIASLGKMYASSLESSPILTKSVTAGILFALSDMVAQRFENKSSSQDDDDDDDDHQQTAPPSLDAIRMISSGLVGLLYFGPAAHAWYNMIFQLLPGTSLISTLQKAALGQCFFGPSFTCLFFAIALVRSGTFSLRHWGTKIRQDLPGAWMAGLGFWPFVDLVSYSLIAPQWIPLFVNACSFVWTIYISLVSNRAKQSE